MNSQCTIRSNFFRTLASSEDFLGIIYIYIMYVCSIAGAYRYNSSSVATLASLAIRRDSVSVLLCIALYVWKVLCRC